MIRRAFLAVVATGLLNGCQQGPDAQQLEAPAQFYLANGGLSATGTQNVNRPCLRGLNIKTTLLGGLFGSPDALVKFVERHRLAETTRTARPSGYVGVTITPVELYEDNWVGASDVKNFCFGTLTLVKVEAVEDAKPLTAGEAEPYIIPGTEAVATRITFKLTDVPAGDFVEDLRANPNLLTRGSMSPDRYGQELTVVAALPLKVENFNVRP